MATLQQQIVEKFLLGLAEADGWDAARISKMQELLTAEKSPKADDFITVFSMPQGGELE